MKNWKTITDESDLPTVDGRYVVQDKFNSDPSTRLFRRPYFETWLFYIEAYIPEPIPPYPGEELDRKEQIEAEINELLKEMREIDYARAKK